ncbi:MAG: carboxypeptidase-like regulatory domain-containing protein [Acidobacteriota bacterium]|nr:carboxypeptidase-like regulatory domain-containing protein [Acidobacteriota bacterium]
MSPPTNGKHYPVSGTVLNSVTSEPIRRALVRVTSGAEQYVAFTGADGRFQLPGVLEGTAFLSGERPGYFDSRSLSTSPFSQANAGNQVTSGTNDFKVLLTPEAKVVGTALDGDGEPIENLQVIVLARQIVQGRKQWLTKGSGTTNESGSFRIEGQIAGTAVVCTGSRPAESLVSKITEVYPPRCFPNSPDLTSAQTIELAAGAEARADFRLQAIPGFSVSGVVQGGQGGYVSAWIDAPGSQPAAFGGTEMNPSTGKFVIRAVPNGTWNFHFHGNDGQGKGFEAYQQVTVGGTNVSGLQVVLQPEAEIPVEIRYITSNSPQVTGQNTEQPGQNTEQPEQNIGSVQVQLVPASEGDAGQYYSSPLPNANNQPGVSQAIALRGVPQGTYHVYAQSGGGGCIDSVSSGNADLSREPLTIAAGSAPAAITVTMRRDCATLDVTTHSDIGGAPGLLLLTSDSAAVQPQIVPIQSNGSASFQNLAPGSYRIYALSDLEGLEYANPQAMRGIESETVTLTPNQKSAVNLQLVRRSQ